MTDEEIPIELLNARVRFWICLKCRARVKWEGDLATCLECGRTNRQQQDGAVND